MENQTSAAPPEPAESVRAAASGEAGGPATGPVPPTGTAITRRDLELVIRRAAELYAGEADAQEAVSEEELLRIGGELGLPTRYVRQALYELPERRAATSLVDRAFGPRAIVCARSLPGEPERVFERLQEYLATEELLQLRRRQGDAAWFSPADDTISNLTRAFKRPKSRFHLARVPDVRLRVRPLEPGRVHIRLALDAGRRRRGAVKGGIIAGIFAGGAAGGGIGTVAAGSILGLVADPVVAVGAGILAGGAAFTLGMGGCLAAASRSFRRWTRSARLECDALLDRLERGERLDPPPAPWRRRLQRRGPTG